MKNKKGIVNIDNKLVTITVVKLSDVLPFMISVNSADVTPVGSDASKNKLICNMGSAFINMKYTRIGNKISFIQLM
tara:strand:- start:256 stop:483 length:228 start_codon:yes stop_codon:yes gene_type:complete